MTDRFERRNRTVFRISSVQPESYAEGPLQTVKAMASERGGIEKPQIVEAFMQRVEMVIALQDIKTAAQEETRAQRRAR